MSVDSDVSRIVKANSTTPVRHGDEVLVAIRPEKFEISLDGPTESHNQVEGKMGPFAYLGDRSHLYVYVPGRDEPVSVAQQNLERDTSQPVWLTWTEDAVVLLPR